MSWTNTGGGDHDGENWTPSNGISIGGTHTNIGSFLITSGYTVYVSTGLILKIYADDIDIDGTLYGQGRGYAGATSWANGSGPGGGIKAADSEGAGGAGYGGAGGAGEGTTGSGGSSYGDNNDSGLNMGSGGGGANRDCSPDYGNGGNGGGAVFLNACTVDVDGSINMNGNAGTFGGTCGGGGGGSGGCLCIICKALICTSSTMSCNGGAGAGGFAGGDGGGGGGGGRAKFFYQSTDVDPLTKTTVTGGALSQGSTAGSTGTEHKTIDLIQSDATHVFGQTINFNTAGPVIVTKIILKVDAETTSQSQVLTIYDSPDKITNYGSRSITVSGTGEKTWTFTVPVILPDGTASYYFEVAGASADHTFNFSCKDVYAAGNVYYDGIEIDGLDLYMKVYTYPHVINPQVYNKSDTNRKCDIAGMILTGAAHRINADGTGHIDYTDDITTAKYAGDQAGISGVTYQDIGDLLKFAINGYLYYKIDCKYPVIGIPTLTCRINILSGTPTIQIAKDIDGNHGGWHNIKKAVVDASGVDTEYDLDADDLSLENKTILYFRFDCDSSATLDLLKFVLDVELDTSCAQIPVVDEGGAANTFRCDQDPTSSIDGTVTLYYNDAKYPG